MADGITSGKICGICGEDCSGRPRIKDQQGRYFCKACAEQAAKQRAAAPAAPKAAPPPPPAEPAEDEALPASFWNDLPAAASPCPSCGSPMSQGGVVCMSCGHNVQTGRGAKIKVAKARTERSTPRLGSALSPGRVAVLLLIAFGAAFPFALGSEGAAWGFYIAAQVLVLTAFITTAVAAFQDGDKGWGIAAILSLVMPCVGLAVLYYAVAKRESGYARMLMAVGFIIGVVSVFPMFATGAFPPPGQQ